jgi:hypothetical protein
MNMPTANIVETKESRCRTVSLCTSTPIRLVPMIAAKHKHAFSMAIEMLMVGV